MKKKSKKEKKDPKSSSIAGMKGSKKSKRPKKFKQKAFAMIIENILSNDPSIQELNLANKFLDKWAAMELSDALMKNSHINSIQLQNNLIGDDGIVYLARMLEKNKTVSLIDLRYNRITNKGAKHLLTCLNNNVFITQLFLEEEDVALDGIVPTGDGGQTLYAIEIEVYEELDRLMASNRKFQQLLRGESNELILEDRAQSYVNVHILQRFPNLTNINLNKNKLKALPSQIKMLKHLKILRLNDNKISSLPNSIGEVSNLRIFEVRRNRLTELPLTLCGLPKLAKLDLGENKFDSLPRFSLGAMPNLKFLGISGNKKLTMLEEFPDKILHDGKQTLHYMRELNEGTEKVYRMKLMFVGNGGVGKTTLLSNISRKRTPAELSDAPTGSKRKSVREEEFHNVATDGIDISTWRTKHKDIEPDKYIAFSSWDFAGQEIYYATHSFFLSERAIYLLVFNLLDTETNNQIEYWLQSIQCRARNAPIILVGTHADDRKMTSDRAQSYFDKLMGKYQKRFPNIVAHFPIALPTTSEFKRGIEALKTALAGYALEYGRRKKFMPQVIPNTYRALEEKITGHRQIANPPIMSYETFKKLALSCEIHKDGIGTATKFLNDLGALLYFNEATCGLNQLVVTDPQWITKTFATLITTTTTSFVKSGLLAFNSLPHIWKEPTYPMSLHKRLIVILEKFEVLHQLQRDGEKKTILIPSLLPPELDAEGKAEMERVWPSKEDIGTAGRVYNFVFVPLGFFSRLIVRFLVSKWDPLLYWQNGIIVRKGKNTRVKLTLEKSTTNLNFPWGLRLWVRGPRPGKFLINLVENIDTLVVDWLISVKRKVTVPCVHCVRENNPSPYEFDLKSIEKAVSSGVSCVKCRGLKTVPIELIAPDIAMSEYSGHKVNYSDIKKGDQIGEGGFALVYKAEWNGEVIALKELHFDAENSDFGFEYDDASDPLAVFTEFRREVFLMSQMRHKNIVALKGLCMDPFCMLLELLPLGSLYDYIHDDEKILNWANTLKLALDIARGMRFMHSSKPPLIHRDLKSPNILLGTEDSRSGPVLIAKVADFGLSRSLMLAPSLRSKVVDNPVWLAPEMMKKEAYTEKVDVYSFGVIAWELIAREDFLGDITFLSAIEDAVVSGKRPAIPERCLRDFPEYGELISACWANNPAKRPSFENCCAVLEDMIEAKLPSLPNGERELTVCAAPVISLRRGGARASSDAGDSSAPIAAGGEASRTLHSVPSTPGVRVNVEKRSTSTIALQPAVGGARKAARKARAPAGGPSAPSTAEAAHEEFVAARAAGAPCVSLVGSPIALRSSSASCMAEVHCSAYGQGVWIGYEDGHICILEGARGTLIASFHAHVGPVAAIAVIGGEEVWTTGDDGTIGVWDFLGGALEKLPLKAPGLCLLEVPSTGDGDMVTVWVGCKDARHLEDDEYNGVVQIWTIKMVKDVKRRRVEKNSLRLESSAPSCMLLSCDVVWLACLDNILCYDPKTLSKRGYLGGHVGQVKFLLSIGNDIWSGGEDKFIKVWSPLEHGSDCLATLEGHGGAVMGICSDGEYVWSCGWDKRIFLWDRRSWAFLKWMPQVHASSVTTLMLLRRDGGDMSIPSGGATVVSASETGEAAFWA